MKSITIAFAAAVLSAVLLVGCKGKNPVAGKKMALTESTVILGEKYEQDLIYVFSDTQYWLDGLEGVKMNYVYDKETDTIRLEGGLGDPIPVSEFKKVK